jgi:hypothetical protein
LTELRTGAIWHSPLNGETSQLRSKYVEFTARSGRVETVLHKPSDRHQATKRPPAANHLKVDLGAVASDDVSELLLVSKRQYGEIEQWVALACIGPIDHAGNFVTIDENVSTL